MIHVLIGAFWGDEGKGKVTDYFCKKERGSIAARYQGGPNAGHTIFVGEQQVTTRMVPSGIFNADIGLIGAGVVLNPGMLLDEVETLERIMPGTKAKLRISSSAHLITPEHLSQDLGKNSQLIGTTKMGVGPCYTDKHRRTGLRIQDALDGDLKSVQDPAFLEVCRRLRAEFSAQVVDCSAFVNEALGAGRVVVAEGAQGSLLDIDHGDYPFVTSSNTFSGAVCTGLGVGPTKVTRVSLVTPIYMSKVGNGAFDTKVGESEILPNFLKTIELDGATGKQRAYGWLDLNALRRSLVLNGATDIILTRTDLAPFFPKISVKDGANFFDFEPWKISSQSPSTLPKELSRFIHFVEERTGVRVGGISYGRKSNEFIEL